jgi:hypothetical protein
LGRKEFERDLFVKAFVAGQPDFPHAAAADHPDEHKPAASKAKPRLK